VEWWVKGLAEEGGWASWRKNQPESFHRGLSNYPPSPMEIPYQVPMKVIQEILGHRSYAITANIYTDVLAAMQKEAMDKWDDVFKSND
jgi:integrase